MTAGGFGRESRWAVVPETETAITLETIPGALCELRYEGEPGHLLRLHADDLGRVGFHACPSGTPSTIELTLTSAGPTGERETRRVVISSDPAGTADSGDGPQAHGWPVVPPLEDGLLTLTNADLVARGYPPRPNPVQAPAHFAQWRRLVSRPWARVGDRRISRDDVTFGPGSDNWSGAVYTEAGPLRKQVEFFYITGVWHVPLVIAGLPASPAYSTAAEWVGFSAGKLFQSGSDSEAWNIALPLGGNWVFTHYWVWIEAYPDPPWGISNMPVSPGDEMQVIIFVADETGTTWFADGDGGGLTPADNKVWFMIYNHTRGTSYWGTLDAVGLLLAGLRLIRRHLLT